MNRAIFLDRDGVFNQKPPEGQYVTRWEDFHLLPGVPEAIALLNRAGFRVIVVTNQRCIAKGLISVRDLESMHRKLSSCLALEGATLDGIYYCPHDLEPVCVCRKPAPGMILDAARTLKIELPSSWMVGDTEIDILAGKNAGCKTARLIEANESPEAGTRQPNMPTSPDIVASSLLDAIHQILHLEGAADGEFTTDFAAT